jgi:hypothetical protein
VTKEIDETGGRIKEIKEKNKKSQRERKLE